MKSIIFLSVAFLDIYDTNIMTIVGVNVDSVGIVARAVGRKLQGRDSIRVQV